MINMEGPVSFSSRLAFAFPIICLVQLLALALSGLYRHSYRYAGSGRYSAACQIGSTSGTERIRSALDAMGTPSIAASMLERTFLGT